MLFDFYLLSANVWRGEVWEAVLGVLGVGFVTDPAEQQFWRPASQLLPGKEPCYSAIFHLL